jgi:hypothetical protein
MNVTVNVIHSVKLPLFRAVRMSILFAALLFPASATVVAKIQQHDTNSNIVKWNKQAFSAVAQL